MAEAYVHRIGRTGRAGKSGIAIAFCNSEETKMLRDIEKIIKKKIPLRHMDGTVEAPLAYDPGKNRTAERSYDHTKAKGSEDYVPDRHGGKGIGRDNRQSKEQGQGFGEKRKPQQGGGKPKAAARTRRATQMMARARINLKRTAATALAPVPANGTGRKKGRTRALLHS